MNQLVILSIEDVPPPLSGKPPPPTSLVGPDQRKQGPGTHATFSHARRFHHNQDAHDLEKTGPGKPPPKYRLRVTTLLESTAYYMTLRCVAVGFLSPSVRRWCRSVTVETCCVP